MSDQVERVLPRDIGVLQAVQDVHGPVWVERCSTNKVASTFLDQRSRNGIRRITVLRRAEINSFRLKGFASRFWKTIPHQPFGHVPCRCDQDQRWDASRLNGLFLHQLPQQKKGYVTAHAGADEDLRPSRETGEDGASFLQPAPDRAGLEGPARLAVAGIVEAGAGHAAQLCPIRQYRRLGAGHLGFEAWKPDHAGPSVAQSGLCQAGDAALGHAGADRQELK